jgi:dynamin 1-like protein
MKSLGKHLEAGPVDQLHLSPREEMETNLIRSLIASYFGIVRQTIEDLVPKAIMHLLVSPPSSIPIFSFRFHYTTGSYTAIL